MAATQIRKFPAQAFKWMETYAVPIPFVPEVAGSVNDGADFSKKGVVVSVTDEAMR